MTRPAKQDKGALINAVSQRVGLSQKRIREYEKEGLISPRREPRTNNRLYEEQDIQQIGRIKELIHEHGFTLACIRFFLAAAPCWVVFDCNRKKSCPSYQSPEIPCYVTVRKKQSTLVDNCSRCPIYLNRHSGRIPLLNKP